MRKTLLILSILLFIVGCEAKEDIKSNEQQNNIQVKDESEINQIALKDIFPLKQGFYWYYEGPLDLENIMYLEKIEQKNDETTLHMKSINEDLTGRRELEDRIFSQKFTITKQQIIRNGKIIVLQTPIKEGTSWKTSYPLHGEINKEATVTITLIKNNIITTETIIPNLKEYADNKYIQITKFEVGKGILSIYNNFDFSPFDEFKMGYKLVKTYEQIKNPENWYLSPYATNHEISGN